MAQACAALRHHPGELLDAVAADVAGRPSEYTRNDWTNVIWALTRLGRSPGSLYALLAHEVSNPEPVSAHNASKHWRVLGSMVSWGCRHTAWLGPCECNGWHDADA